MPPRKRKSIRDTDSGQSSSSGVPAIGSQTAGQVEKRAAMLRAISARSVDVLSASSSYAASGSNSPGPLYVDLGNCNNFCEFCGAAFWFEERVKASPQKCRPRYNSCCKAGAVRLHYPTDPPTSIKDLYSNSHFMANIRAYNSMFSMTSFGADIDDAINRTPGPYVFKVAGQVSHWIGSLLPPPDANPRFLQMYIYDIENEVANRLRFFPDSDHSQLCADIVAALTHVLAEVNEYVKLFKSARELCASDPVPDFAIALFNNTGGNHGMPAVNCLGAIIRDDDPLASAYDIVIHSKEGVPKRISKLHPSYMPLQYPLLFPFAEQGWSPQLRLHGRAPPQDTNLTMSMFYGYQLHDRQNIYTLLLRGGRLFQQYLVDAYICIEQCRLDYVRAHQNRFRSEHLRGIHDAFLKGDTEGQHVGKRTILPSSFTGGPRYMYKHYQDALAICRVHGNPQYFITFTCNVRWPEIKRCLLDVGCSNAQDRPDIIARVFQMKVNALRKFLKERRTFGAVAADLYTIEFQKRGLPHCHMLLWVTPECKIKDAADVDRFISAEIPNSAEDPVLHRIVTESMMHGPCGIPKQNAPCMKHGRCSKSFPKSYEQTTRFDKQGYVHYRRLPQSEPVNKSGVPLDNGFVVPYNPSLCLHFEAHINVEYCGWSMLIKYLFKYISKGVDRICYSITRSIENASTSVPSVDRRMDEVANFVDGRFVCPHEAAWRIFEFPIHHRNPAVQLLSVHLEHMQNIVFQDQQKLKQIVDNPTTGNTTLTEWLLNNQKEPNDRDLRYIDYLARFRWDPSGKGWIRRINNINPTIGRLAYVHPSCGELFYLRMLLGHQKGCCTFDDIRTISGIVYPTYRAACEKLGLIGDDREWSACFIEASAWGTAAELRTLFTNMLLHCEISNPLQLWRQHWRQMSDDIVRNITEVASCSSTELNEQILQQHVLYELELLLNSSSGSRSLSEFGLPLPPDSMVSMLRNRLLTEEKCYDTADLATKSTAMERLLNNVQVKAYNMIVNSVMQNRQLLLFVYGHGGTGKTFLWTTIIDKIRSTSKIVLAVAASGIASLLLPSGRTAHSRFKIPLDLTDDSVCYIKKHTQLSELLAETSLIVWDEAPMNDRRCFESLDKSLRDIIGNHDQPFGGKSVLLGGDFRQTLPVKPKATKAEVIASSLPKSHLWKKFVLIKLQENMRLSQSAMSIPDKEATLQFSNWLLNVGDGKIGDPSIESPKDAKIIDIPTHLLIQPGKDSLQHLIRFVYDKSILDNPTATNLAERAIVCPKNETADEINSLVLAYSPGEYSTYFSVDSITPHSRNRGDIDLMYPPEYLNTLNFNGIPPHCLKLKVNTPVIMLRNIDQKSGLCNGTRLLISQLLPRIIEARIITGTAIGHRVYIPRINFVHNSKELPFVFNRRQFPIKTCYAMTINKSQGQSLKRIAVYLPQPIFSHGQLYVALSRATSPNGLKVLIESHGDLECGKTKNIVYSELLTEVEAHEEGRLASIVPQGAPVPVNVRFIRKWQPRGKKSNTFYFLIDKHGDGIQASVHWMDKDMYDKKITLTNCYMLDKYICDDQPSAPRMSPHPASIRLGTNTDINPIPTPIDFPTNCFYLCPYADLHLRTDPKYPLHTDFMAKLEGSSPDKTCQGRDFLKLYLKDISGEKITATLWEEALPFCNVHDMYAAEEPIIVAVTSLRVGKFYDKLQLGSTLATYTYFNPQTPEAQTLRNRFIDQAQQNIAPEAEVIHEAIQESNKKTVTELLHQNIDENQGKTFICTASIVSYSADKPWYYTSCPYCPRKTSKTPTGWSCETHENLKEPKFKYIAFTKIADNTDTTSATIFDEALTTIVEMSCRDVVIKEGFTDRFQIPKPLFEAMGKDHTMHVQYTRTTGPAGSLLAVNKAAKKPPTNTPPDSIRTPDPTYKKSDTKTPSTTKRQLTFEEPGAISETKRTRFPE